MAHWPRAQSARSSLDAPALQALPGQQRRRAQLRSSGKGSPGWRQSQLLLQCASMQPSRHRGGTKARPSPPPPPAPKHTHTHTHTTRSKPHLSGCIGIALALIEVAVGRSHEEVAARRAPAGRQAQAQVLLVALRGGPWAPRPPRAMSRLPWACQRRPCCCHASLPSRPPLHHCCTAAAAAAAAAAPPPPPPASRPAAPARTLLEATSALAVMAEAPSRVTPAARVQKVLRLWMEEPLHNSVGERGWGGGLRAQGCRPCGQRNSAGASRQQACCRHPAVLQAPAAAGHSHAIHGLLGGEGVRQPNDAGAQAGQCQHLVLRRAGRWRREGGVRTWAAGSWRGQLRHRRCSQRGCAQPGRSLSCAALSCITPRLRTAVGVAGRCSWGCQQLGQKGQAVGVGTQARLL